jgi:hypothetical protein
MPSHLLVRNPGTYHSLTKTYVTLATLSSPRAEAQGELMSQETLERLRRDALRADPIAVPAVLVRLAGAALAFSIAAAHVADQGGITLFTAPDWLGWAYRLIEVGGVLTGIALIAPRTARLGWVAGVLLGVAPFLGFLASRTVGVPGDPGDVGNWSDWIGTLALILEAGLVTVSVGMLWARFGRRSPATIPAQRVIDVSDSELPQLWDVLRPTDFH